jgi:hypothetical protein
MKLGSRTILGASSLAVAILAACSPSSGGATSHGDGGAGDDGGSSSGGSSGGSGDGGSSGGVVTTFAAGQTNPGGIVANGSYVVWTTCNKALGNLNGPGSIMAVPTAGGTPVALATNTDNGARLAIDATTVYWFGPDDGTIMEAPLAGGAAMSIAKNLTNTPFDLTIDATFVYWTTGATIHSVPVGGGANKTLVSGQTLTANDQTPSLAVNASGIYSTTATSILKFPLAGGAATTLASGQMPLAITADATTVYWTDFVNGVPSVLKVAASGGTTATLATLATPAVPAYVTVDASNVYWIEALGSVKKVPLGGGTPVTLAGAPNTPGGIAVDATSVYWTDISGGKVLKTPK